MHDDRRQVEQRLRRAVREAIGPGTYAMSFPLSVSAWHVSGGPVSAAEALSAVYEPFHAGSQWGPAWSTTWFRLDGMVPEEWAGSRVEVVLDLNSAQDLPGCQPEGLVYTESGTPLKGITPRNRYAPVADPAHGGEPVRFFVEAAANPRISGSAGELSDILTAPRLPMCRFGGADLAVLDTDVWHLSLDVEVLTELMEELSESDPRRHEILRACERMLDALDYENVAETAALARGELAEVLSRPASASAHTVAVVGHAHIDSAWLWPLQETHRKCARTFANATALVESYPEFIFACSQAQQYAWIKDDQPDIYERIKMAVATGAWVPVGSMWVEADGNIPGGEALVRHIVHGKRFFADEFGVDTKGIWLPDSFGYNGAFPQIARLAGIDWFLSQKMSWNETNKMPHHTFWWEGIDGTRVFTHFPPADTYNSKLAGAELAYSVRNYAEKGAGTISLMPFGYGDGGGGPTREMLEKARRFSDLEGSPRVKIIPPDEFFALARAEYPDAPVWRGEMYLETHRATYTTQAKMKAGNRRVEHMLRELELWAATSAVVADTSYPYDQLDRLWKQALLLQFHDILPGSSIAWVHREARDAYADIIKELDRLIEQAAASLSDKPADGPMRVLNASPAARAEVITVPPTMAGAGEVRQRLTDGHIALWATAPALGIGEVQPNLPPHQEPVSASERSLDNGILRVDLDETGRITSITDRVARREVLSPDAYGNLLQLHPDQPNKSDAWDIDRHYLRRHVDLTDADSIEVVESGPLLGAVRVVRSFGSSRIIQTMILRSGARQLEFDTDIDWRESGKVLKAAFPIDVHAETEAAEIQFGHVHRPTHTNTSWDFARFEVYNHRWIHVGEPGYGVALVNDAKYGHDISRGTRDGGGTTTTVRLTLLRAPHHPDPHADIGMHHFTYALCPGVGVRQAVEAGYALNLPLRPARVRPVPPLVAVDSPNLVIEAVKLADDHSGDIIVRLYESQGGRAAGTLRPCFAMSHAHLTDLLERPLAAVEIANGSLTIALRPFQILTLRLCPSDPPLM